MRSILDYKILADEIYKASEVAGYLWEKGWAERNGGNITINVTDYISPAIAELEPIIEPLPIGAHLPALKGQYFFGKGTLKRMRDLARLPMDNGSLIRISDDCKHYEIIADNPIMPTSELLSHLSIHNYLIENKTGYKAVLHTHPTELISMSHNPVFLKKGVLTDLLWRMIPEARLFCPRGLGIVPYETPGSTELANATLEQFKEYDVVIWEKHGVCCVGRDILDAFDTVDTLTKSAQIYLNSIVMGFEPEGLTKKQMELFIKAYGL